jgi:hypothetical protein
VIDLPVLSTQIGRGNLLAISGGRIHHDPAREQVAVLRVSHGYHVEVELTLADDYTVRRVHNGTVKGEETGVYADQVSDAAYRASCYVNLPFGEHNPGESS